MNLTKSEEERKPQHNSIIVTYEIGCLYEGDILHLKWYIFMSSVFISKYIICRKTPWYHGQHWMMYQDWHGCTRNIDLLSELKWQKSKRTTNEIIGRIDVVYWKLYLVIEPIMMRYIIRFWGKRNQTKEIIHIIPMDLKIICHVFIIYINIASIICQRQR